MVGAALLTAQATAQESNPEIPDPVEILRHHLSHGIGESAMDSDLANDPVNAAILVAARNGMETRELSRRMPNSKDFNERLVKLENAGLIQTQSERIRTRFPILLGERKGEYDRLVSQAAEGIYENLIPSVRLLLQGAGRRGWSRWSYHFVWSQVMDSQFIWGEMIERGLVPPLTPVLTWVIYPQHPFKSGTNYYPDTEIKDPMLAVSWTPDGANTVGWIGGQWSVVYTPALQGKTTDMDTKNRLEKMGLLASDGRVLVPVLRRTDALYRQLQETAETYLELLIENLPAERFAAVIGVEQDLAWAMAYHDVSWELVSRMVGNGEFNRPLALSPGKAGDLNPPSMIGVCSVVPASPKFIDQIMKALGDNPSGL